jgi:hypothetical protein
MLIANISNPHTAWAMVGGAGLCDGWPTLHSPPCKRISDLKGNF